MEEHDHGPKCKCHLRQPVDDSLVQTLDEVAFTNSVFGIISSGGTAAKVREFFARHSTKEQREWARRRDNSGYTCLHYAARKCTEYRNNLVIVDILLSLGADVNAQTPLGATPLHRAACQLNIACVNLFLAAGADKNIVDTKGLTAYDWVVQNLYCSSPDRVSHDAPEQVKAKLLEQIKPTTATSAATSAAATTTTTSAASSEETASAATSASS